MGKDVALVIRFRAEEDGWMVRAERSAERNCGSGRAIVCALKGDREPHEKKLFAGEENGWSASEDLSDGPDVEEPFRAVFYEKSLLFGRRLFIGFR